MTKTSFLARTTWGQPRYLLVAMACMFALALIPMGLRRALQPTDVAPEQVLSGDYAEVRDLAWVRDHFGSNAEVVVSWEGCTLGDSEPLALLAKKLESHTANGVHWFERAYSGPQAMRDLMDRRPGLGSAEALRQLEGSLIGPPQSDALGRSLGHAERATCLIVKLSPEAMADLHARRLALEAIPTIAEEQCGIDPTTMHMMGAPVESVAVGFDAPGNLLRVLAVLGSCSAALCWWRLRSVRLAFVVVGVATAAAALAMALPSYAAILQVLWYGHTTTAAQGLSGQLIALPAVVYVIVLASALHLVHAYVLSRRAAARGGESAAAEEAVSTAVRPILFGALAAAVMLASLALCDVSMLRQFGVYAAPGVLAGIALLFGIAAVVLHRYPLDRSRLNAIESGAKLPGLSRFALDHSGPMLGVSLLSLVVVSAGAWMLGAQLTPFDSPGGYSAMARDLAWFERHMAGVVPLEIVLTMPAERLRAEGEDPEQDGQQYRLTLDEQLALVRETTRRLRTCPQLGGILTAAMLPPRDVQDTLKSTTVGDDGVAADYRRSEHNAGGERLTGRELWRLSSRVARRTEGGASVDFGQVVADARNLIEPVLWSYQQRDRIVQVLHEHGKKLGGARVCVLFRAPDRATTPPAATQEHLLAELLSESGTAAEGVTYFNLATYDGPGRGDAAGDDAYRREALASLRQKDVLVLASAASDPTAHKIAETGLLLANVTDDPTTAESRDRLSADGGGPRPILATYAGVGAVVERAEQLLVANLPSAIGIAWSLIGVALVLGTMSVPAGLLTTCVGATPLLMALGLAGWLGLNIDLAVATALSITAGISVAAVLQVVGGFQRGMSTSLDRKAAAEQAVQATAPALMNIVVIAGLSVVPLAVSATSSLRDVGLMAGFSVIASMLVCLAIMPALLVSSLGWLLAPIEVRRLDPLLPRIRAAIARRRSEATAVEEDAELIPLPQNPKAPHFGDAPAATPTRRAVLSLGADERREIADGPHAALQAKLQGLRRPRTGESPAS